MMIFYTETGHITHDVIQYIIIMTIVQIFIVCSQLTHNCVL